MAGRSGSRYSGPTISGRMNLYLIPGIRDLYLSKSGHAWSTKRKGLRQRKYGKWNRLLMLRVSQDGHAANCLAATLMFLALSNNVRVHWDGTSIQPGWIASSLDAAGEGKSALDEK